LGSNNGCEEVRLRWSLKPHSGNQGSWGSDGKIPEDLHARTSRQTVGTLRSGLSSRDVRFLSVQLLICCTVIPALHLLYVRPHEYSVLCGTYHLSILHNWDFNLDQSPSAEEGVEISSRRRCAGRRCISEVFFLHVVHVSPEQFLFHEHVDLFALCDKLLNVMFSRRFRSPRTLSFVIFTSSTKSSI
jgi:hypothetical protein